MRHCCEFDAYDIWYLKNTDDYTNRTLFMGTCPICNKSVAILLQKRSKTNGIETIKKVGQSAITFVSALRREKALSRNSLNRMKLKPKPYGWRYGLNKEKKDKDGNVSIDQYAVDFYGNSELVKKIK